MIEDAEEARFQVGRNYPFAAEFEIFTDTAGTVLGWTFAVDRSHDRYGWVLANDASISPATETYRSDAETYGRSTALDGR
ncbi:hypothetical protein ACFQ6U_13835 [Streptomyces sp. NPDC056465]|uniref:hypothetical protein n=1 Tax=unclassified Streptomyces TaxID=2593676 RepID=UPI0035D5C603